MLSRRGHARSRPVGATLPQSRQRTPPRLQLRLDPPLPLPEAALRQRVLLVAQHRRGRLPAPPPRLVASAGWRSSHAGPVYSRRRVSRRAAAPRRTPLGPSPAAAADRRSAGHGGRFVRWTCEVEIDRRCRSEASLTQLNAAECGGRRVPLERWWEYREDGAQLLGSPASRPTFAARSAPSPGVKSRPVSPSATRLDSPPSHSLRVRAASPVCLGRHASAANLGHQNRQPAMRRRLISAHLGRPRLISAQSRPISARPRRRRRRARPKPSPRARRNPASPSRRASPAPNRQDASPQSCHAAVARRLGGHSQRRPPPRTRARGPRPAERLVKMKSPIGAYFFFTRGPRPRRTPANTAAAPANSRRKLASGQTSQREVLTVGEGRCESKL